MIKIKITVSTMQKMNLFEKNMKKFLLCFKTITEVNKFYLLLKQYQFDQVEKQKSPFYYICIRMSDKSKIKILTAASTKVDPKQNLKLVEMRLNLTFDAEK